MKTMRSFSLFAVALVVGLAMAAPAKAVLYNIDWTGSSGWTMTGMFGFDDSLIGTGTIRESQIDSFMIEVFENGISQGTWDRNTDPLTGEFVFLFDTTSEQFLTGPGVISQVWNRFVDGSRCEPVGFASGVNAQDVCVDNALIPASLTRDLSTLTATRKESVPEPSTLALFAIALGGLGFMVRRRVV